ncbi:MAG: universal stress protein [Candidatus Kapaibacterium sp.]|jgi:nucleotide-binding universal stress UspA family protein
MYAIRSILVPTDFSDNAAHAIGYAKELAQQNAAVIHLLHVIEPVAYPVNWGYAQVGFLDIEQEYTQAADTEMKTLADGLIAEGFTVITTIQTAGRASDEIDRYAAEHGISLICIATHGRGGIDHLLFGSTTERVLRKTPCPVFVVKTPKNKQ